MMADAAQHEPRTGCVFLLLPCGGVYTVEVNECDRLSDVVSRANECHGPLVPSAATLHHQGRRLPPSTRLSTHGGLHEANLHVQYPLRGGSSPGVCTALPNVSDIVHRVSHQATHAPGEALPGRAAHLGARSAELRLSHAGPVRVIVGPCECQDCHFQQGHV
ncbi:uncharacterized protein LOC144738503 isoform X2 [Lampetra planeri]